jgi:hypothetical protein
MTEEDDAAANSWLEEASVLLSQNMSEAAAAACSLALQALERSSSQKSRSAAEALYLRSIANAHNGHALQSHADLLLAAQISPEKHIMAGLRSLSSNSWAPEGDVPEGSLLGGGRQFDTICRQHLRSPVSAAELLQKSEACSDSYSSEPSTPRRFRSTLKGRAVPRCRLDSPLASELLRRNLPVILTGHAVIDGESAAGQWTADTLAERLEGSEQVAVVAPKRAARRFTYYQSAHHTGDYSWRSFFQPTVGSAVKEKVAVGPAFLREQHDAATERVSYLQIRVFHAHEGGFGACELPETLGSELRSSVRQEALQSIARAARFGPLVLSQLFLAPRDALSPCHYDEQHNVFVQIAGHKSFLLFAPDHAAPGLAPYPLHHAAARRARTDIEGSAVAASVQGMRNFEEKCPDEGGGTEDCRGGGGRSLRGSGVEAVIGPGDALVIPALWWHHVHALGQDSLSISFWMARDGTLAEAVRRTVGATTSASAARGQKSSEGASKAGDAAVWRELRLRLAKECEAVVGDVLGPMNVRAFFLRLGWRCAQPWGATLLLCEGTADDGELMTSAAQSISEPRLPSRPAWPVEYPLDERTWAGDPEAAAADRENTELLEPRLQNWLLDRLGSLLGAAAVPGFLAGYMGESRFGGLI